MTDFVFRGQCWARTFQNYYHRTEMFTLNLTKILRLFTLQYSFFPIYIHIFLRLCVFCTQATVLYHSYYKTLLKEQLNEKVFFCVINGSNYLYTCKYEILREFLVYGAFLIFQHGLIHTGDTTYFIEPVRQPKNVTNGHPHIIYQHKPRTESEHHNNRHTSDTCGNNGTLTPPPPLSLSISLENRECTLQTQCDSGFLINHSKLLCHE